MCRICLLPENGSTYPRRQTRMGRARPSKLVGQLETGYTSRAVRLWSKRRRNQAIGISYQMHGLVCVDKNQQVLRPSIIWCDSRAVPYGQKAFRELGETQCLSHLLNSPGNFTASKLAWVKENEPKVYERIYKVMLPGDYIAMRLTGEICTTVSGLSEGMFWDFKENKVA